MSVLNTISFVIRELMKLILYPWVLLADLLAWMHNEEWPTENQTSINELQALQQKSVKVRITVRVTENSESHIKP